MTEETLAPITPFDAQKRATELAILDALRSVVDPEIGMNVVELALIRQVLVARGESVPHPGIGQAQPGCHGTLIALQQLGPAAPRQKLGVALDAGHQVVHLPGRVPKKDRSLDVLHTMSSL